MRFTTDNKFIIKWVLVDKYVEKRVFKMFFLNTVYTVL